jgi:hypothetical protein
MATLRRCFLTTLLVTAAIAASHAQTYAPPAAAAAVRQLDAEQLKKILLDTQIDAVRRTKLAARQFELEQRGLVVRQAQGTAGASDVATAMAAAKLTGACGVLQSLVNFQTTTRMNGGDAFIVRFVRMEVARLGMTVEDYFKSCKQAIAISDQLASVLRN